MASNMKIKKKSSEKTFDIINGAFLLILVILVAYPLYYVLRVNHFFRGIDVTTL